MSRAASVSRLLLLAAALAALGAAGTPSSPRRPTPKLQQRKVPPPAPFSRYAGEPISLDLKDADLKDVLRTFATLARLNIAIDPDVKGSVTIRLHDVPWDQALDVILRINGLGSVLEGNVLRVGEPRKLIPAPVSD
jgi:type IV pilus assembly protein PilQ